MLGRGEEVAAFQQGRAHQECHASQEDEHFLFVHFTECAGLVAPGRSKQWIHQAVGGLVKFLRIFRMGAFQVEHETHEPWVKDLERREV